MKPLPKIVFQHFREPQNLGALADPTAVGEVDGRGPDTKLRLFLQVEDGTVTDASFETVRDRASNAPLSLLTTMIKGRALAEVESLDVADIGEHFGLYEENLPMLVPAWETLQATLAALAGKPNPYAFEGGLVCTCLGVREGRIRRAIKERECRTVREVSFWTRACTGCRSCRGDIERMLGEDRREAV